MSQQVVLTDCSRAEYEDLTWLAELEAERAEDRRVLAFNMAFSSVFHLILIAIFLAFAHTPPGKTDGLTEIELVADVPKLGDEDAPENDGMPSEARAAEAANKELTREDISLTDQAKRLDEALDDVAARQEKEMAKQRADAAREAANAETNRVKGIRSADAKIHGQLGKRGGIGGLEPRTFYGLKVHSKKMVLILDVSGSMNIPYAKMNLKNAYRALGPKEKFALVCYDNRVWYWPGTQRLAHATRENKQAADAWVDAIQGGGATNIYEALETAFKISRGGESADTFYFLSDGFATFPRDGRRLTKNIIDATLKWNGTERVIMHTIGIFGRDLSGREIAPDEALLKELARLHRGKYKAIR